VGHRSRSRDAQLLATLRQCGAMRLDDGRNAAMARRASSGTACSWFGDAIDPDICCSVCIISSKL
jgi:hypothetical protein